MEIFFLLLALFIGFFFVASLISKLSIPRTVADWEVISTLGIGTAISLALFFVTRKDEILLPTDGYALRLYQKRPTRKEADEFIDVLKNRTMTYVRNKYLILNAGLDPDTRARQLFWLFERGFVSQEEFEQLKQPVR